MDKKINKNSKINQLNLYLNDSKDKKLTTNHGVGIANTDDSLKAGMRGPTIMEDFHLREKLTHFDHERIPERIVHARGYGAHGHFELYESLSHLTSAKFLKNPEIKTPVFVRFSTVAGSKGSADTVRDVRGFAVKFYTEDGNYDIVGNNVPVFFIQDAIKFPDLIHSIKPEPNKDIPQAATAHDTFWDFISNTPESAHMVMWIMSDRTIPRSYRMMEGFGVHTYRFINDKGEANFIKFHWKPMLGVHSLVWDEAQTLCGVNSDFHRRDLWDAIENGNYPQWELGIQVIPQEKEFDFDFDVLDPTKLWPEELIPVQKIGVLTLEKNVENFFAETEQVAFCPANIVPGIDFTNDPLLQGRLFSYLDTQLIRLGGPNFQEIPINRPICEVHNNQRDGHFRMSINKGQTAYHPNSLMDNCPHTAQPKESCFNHYQEKVDGYKIRTRSASFNDHYTQAIMFYNSMSAIEKKHIQEALKFELGNCINKGVKDRMITFLNNINGELATIVAKGIGVIPPETPFEPKITLHSPALSQANTVKSAKSLKVAILVAEGCNKIEISKMIEKFKKAKVNYEIVSLNQGYIKSAEGKKIAVNKSLLVTASVNYDGLYLTGGKMSVDNLMKDCKVCPFVTDFYKHYKTIIASDEAIDILVDCQLKGITFVDINSKGEVLSDCGIVTTRKASNIDKFAQEAIDALAQHKHWCRLI